MLNKAIFLTVGLLCTTLNVSAQQEGHFSNLANNPYILNPAAGGMMNVLNIESTTRFQWLGYNGGPRSIMVTANSPVNFKKGANARDEFNVSDEFLFEQPTRSTGKTKHVIGGKFLNDAIGPFMKTSLYGTYAIHLAFSKNINFGAGIGLGWSNYGINNDRVTLYHENDITYSEFLGTSTSQNFLDANAGIVFYSDKLFAGISMMQAFNNKAAFENVVTESSFNRHYFLTAKYKFETRGDISVEPILVGKYVANSPLSFDIGSRIIYRNSAWGGLQFRTSNALLFQVGSTLIKNLYLNYSYEYSIGKIRMANNGTHEIQLGIYLGNNRNIDKEIKGNKASQP